MKHIGSALLFLSFGSTAYAQDVYFFNATPRPYKLVMTLPNGANESANLSEGTDAITYAYFNLVPAIKEVQIQLVDEAGAAVCSGKAKRDVAYTFFADAQGVKMVPTGFYGGTDIQAALFMNSTGEPLTLDLIGNNGLGSVRGIVPPAQFDPKAPVKLDPKEASYNFKVTNAGAPVAFYNDNANVTPGKYYLLRKDARGQYRLETLGYIKR